MSLSHSGSIHVVTKDARFSRGFPSSISSSLMIWYAASFGIDCSGILNLRARAAGRPISRKPGDDGGDTGRKLSGGGAAAALFYLGSAVRT